MSDEAECQGGQRVLTYLRNGDAWLPTPLRRRMPPTLRGSPRLSDGGVGNMCGEQQRGLAVGTRRAVAAAAAMAGSEGERERERRETNERTRGSGAVPQMTRLLTFFFFFTFIK